MGFSPPSNQPRRNLQQHITESRNCSSQTTTPCCPCRPHHQEPDDNFTYDSDFEHNRDTYIDESYTLCFLFIFRENMFECRRRAMLQLFLEAHFVYLYLVHFLELFFALPLSSILSHALDRSGLPPCSSHVCCLFTCYLPFITCIQYSHVNQFHMSTIITCLSFYF